MAHLVLTPMKFASTSLFCWMFILAVVVPFDAQGQPPWMRDDNGNEAIRERMEAMAVGFLTEELELDAESAQVFWPIYNAHKEELDRATRDLKKIGEDLNQFEGGSEDEFNALLDRLEAAEFGLPQLRAQFLRDVSGEFGPDFAVRCIQAQKKFKEVVRQRMQQRMSGQKGRRLGGRPRLP